MSYEHPKAIIPRCSECGLKRKGPNHDKGEQHIRRSQAIRAGLSKKSA